MTITIPSGRTLPLKAKAGGGFSSSAYNPPVGDLSFMPETGFSITGSVADLAEVTISGQDFGTKPPQRHFDRVDRYWKNGTEVVDPYASAVDGDRLPTSLQNAESPFLGNTTVQMESWKLRSEAARPGRSLGYQVESGPDGDMEFYGIGSTNQGFAGWPASQRDAEEIYVRYWHYQRYFGSETTTLNQTLASSLSAGATSATLVEGPSAIGSGVDGLEEFYITLDDGSLHYCIQTEPEISNTEFTFSPALPSAASAGNEVFYRKENLQKIMRVRDDGEGALEGYNIYSFSGFRSEISNDDMSLVPGKPKGQYTEGVWELHEHYLKCPKLEADLAAGFVKRSRRAGTVVLNIQGTANNSGGIDSTPAIGWPSSGVAVTFFGFEQDRVHRVPGNKFRLSDIYVDTTRQRVEIGIGNDNLYQCSNREPCPIKTWSNSITVNLNALPFTEAELTQARLFVVDADDVPTLVGRIQNAN